MLRIVLVTLSLGWWAVARAQSPAGLDIYWIDVEGGASTLIVTPQREVVLVDAGWARSDERDARRIEAAMMDAGVTEIDFFIASHFHGDHVGGLPALARRVPIKRYLDHGESVEQDTERGRGAWLAYAGAAPADRRLVAVGDTLPLASVKVTFVAANGALAPAADGAPLNPLCAQASSVETMSDENAHSLGFMLTLGAFDFLDLGDLTVDRQLELACPSNRLGTVDLLEVPHHATGVAPELTLALQPAAAVSNNGPHKGGLAESMEAILRVPDADLWQLHRALDTDSAHNTSEPLTANVTDSSDCKGYWIKATVWPDGERFTINNARNGESRTYLTR